MIDFITQFLQTEIWAVGDRVIRLELLLLLTAMVVASIWVSGKFRQLLETFLGRFEIDKSVITKSGFYLRVATLLLGLGITAQIGGINVAFLIQVLSFEIPIGGENTQFTILNGIIVIGLTTGLIVGSGHLKRWMAREVFQKRGIDVGVTQAVTTITRYALVALGIVVILQANEIDLSALTVLAGAAGVGIGFGLQNIINNFFSGLIILFERPIKVGDRVDVGSIRGDVVKISARSTTIVTNENIAIIVPNSEFISQRVTNWSYTDKNVRIDVPVGVSYSSDPDEIRDILLEVATESDYVMKHPKPDVTFDEFGDSSLNFSLRVWTDEFATKPKVLRSHLNYDIARKFKERDVEIPFPQRDLHIRSGLPETN